MKAYLILCITAMSVIFYSCKRDQPIATEAMVQFEIVPLVGAENKFLDTIRYTNAAGNLFSVSHLEMILSDFKFKSGSAIYKASDVFYLNIREPETLKFTIPQIPNDNYDEISFLIGLPDDLNITGALPNIESFNNLAWPELMGGGYHFLKFEGHFISGSDTVGYGIHMGTNGMYSQNELRGNFEVKGINRRLKLKMDMNEWFESPYTYDLDVDPSYTMWDSIAMTRIAANGNNVFSVIKIE